MGVSITASLDVSRWCPLVVVSRTSIVAPLAIVCDVGPPPSITSVYGHESRLLMRKRWPGPSATVRGDELQPLSSSGKETGALGGVPFQLVTATSTSLAT